MSRQVWRKTGLDWLVLLLVFILGLVFFFDHASLQLASDDVAWLQGDAPTVFDQYRKIPRLFFISLHTVVGPSAVAALVMIFLFHSLNTLLVYDLGRRLLGERIAALSAACVFLINPITLNTLTWISCFSYVLGTSLALLALLAFWKACEQDARHALLFSVTALICFGAGLFCTHEIFFLPVVFLIWGWMQRELRRGTLLLALGMAMALLVNVFVYDFGRYGVEPSRLFSFDFLSAYASSVLSSGLALALAYPLSFLFHTQDFLRICFAEPLRWAITAFLLAGGVLSCRNDRWWRLSLSLSLSFLFLITPYVIRLYLTPDNVNYHISYVLSGRVFYLPFAMIALVMGLVASRLHRLLRTQRRAWLVLLVPLAAYGHALWYYDKTDFLGLSVALQDISQAVPPRWNPYANEQPVWFLLASLVIFLPLAIHSYISRRTGADLTSPDSA